MQFNTVLPGEMREAGMEICDGVGCLDLIYADDVATVLAHEDP